MDFTPGVEQVEAGRLAVDVLQSALTDHRRKQLADAGVDFDAELWRSFAQAGLLALPLPDEHGGAGLGLLEMCQVLIEVGRQVAPIPAGVHLPATVALSRFGTPGQRDRWLPDALNGGSLLTAALMEPPGALPDRPVTRATATATGYRLDGVKTLVPAGTRADLFLVPAATDAGVGVFAVTPADAGVEIAEQCVAGDYRLAELTLGGVALDPDRLLGDTDGGCATMLRQLCVLAVCAEQFGITGEAVTRTADYAKVRKQFDRPIGSFQAVAHRLADGYIDIIGQELTLWKAAWLLDNGLPADAALAAAKFWAAEAGHRVAHSAVHIHGGVGVDLSGDIHRYYSRAKHLEFTYGAAHQHARELGRLMGADDFFDTDTAHST